MESEANGPRFRMRTVALWSVLWLIVGAAAASVISVSLAPSEPAPTVVTVSIDDSSLVVFAEPPAADSPRSFVFVPIQDPTYPGEVTITQERVVGIDGDRTVFAGLGVMNSGNQADPVWEPWTCLSVEDPDGTAMSGCSSLANFEERGIGLTGSRDDEPDATRYHWGPAGGLTIETVPKAD